MHWWTSEVVLLCTENSLDHISLFVRPNIHFCCSDIIFCWLSRPSIHVEFNCSALSEDWVPLNPLTYRVPLKIIIWGYTPFSNRLKTFFAGHNSKVATYLPRYSHWYLKTYVEIIDDSLLVKSPPNASKSAFFIVISPFHTITLPWNSMNIPWKTSTHLILNFLSCSNDVPMKSWR